ncbi:FecR family protein [Solimonas soli]|uniref:FecR family protein n=1 Tax=Solimonas soli TaxID=413479 RepID=UPI00047F7F11|nr:FecR domain-containing protein [Solimonas soli]
MNPKETTTTGLEQAALWWQRLREADVAPETVSEWLDWCQRDAANLQAFEKIEALGGRFEALDAQTRAGLMRELLDDATPGSAPPADRQRRARKPWRLALAAGFCAALIGAGVYLYANHGTGAVQRAVYVTAKAQSRELELSDGSHVALGAATRLDVAYSADVRDLQLGDGEAYFEVAHNVQRPFVVRVGRLKVVAVGTAFNIRKTGAHVEVVVTQGAVDVENAASLNAAQSAQTRLPNDGAIRVAAGQLVVADAAQGLSVRPADRVAATTWRQGRLQFVDEDLSIVVANLNRYARHEVVIADASLDGLRYTGTIVQGRETEWLAAIEKVFPVDVQRDAEGRALLRRREATRAALKS